MSTRTRVNGYRPSIAVLAIAAMTIVVLLAAGPLEARPSALPAGNLVQNPGGEADVGAKDSNTTDTPQSWTTTGTFSAVQYGAPDFLTTAFSAQIGGGANFMSGGRNAPLSTATQTIDVSAAAPDIDAGGVQAKLSAYLGGYTSQRDAAMVDATFLSATDAALGSLRVGPVTPADRQSKTTLVLRAATAAVPKGTTKIKVVLTSTRADGTYNDGYMDNISLEFGTTPPPPPPVAGKPTLAAACAGKTLVATLRPAAGAKVTSVTFLVNGRLVTVDSKAPFTLRVRVTGHPAHLKVTARVRAAGKTTLVSKTIKPC
jgi:hypothetical protein